MVRFTVCIKVNEYLDSGTHVILPAVVGELRKYKPSFFPAVNTLFNALVNNEEFKQPDQQ